jgi:hypothetical protein
MAIPINVSEDRIIYIVEITMGSQFRGRSWDLDDFNRQMEYKHGKDIRNEIGALRQEINTVVNGTCMKFHKKIKFTNAAGKATLERECANVDRRMKQIDPSLHVTPLFFPQTITQLSDGNMFDLMKKQLNEQINQKVLDRIELVIENSKRDDGTYKPMTNKTRDALLKMIEGVKAINILDDPTVTARLETLKAQIQTASLIPMRDELLSYIEDIQGADNLELTIDRPVKLTADNDLDEDKYKARPAAMANEIEGLI